jgi:tRNA-2-methylthio-N6-dimethylallyladenosine synthase
MRSSSQIAIVPIIEGCDKFCSYCIVPFSRGRERSREPADIIKEVEELIENGFLEVQLVGQNVNSYRPATERGLERFEGSIPFSKLLRAVAHTGIKRVRFTTSFPRDFHADIVRAMDDHHNLCDWVHLPAQSGSDNILKAMRRGYNLKDYLAKIELIKKAKRRYSITSDIIIGFPGETSDDFNRTVELVKHCQYDGLYIFKYSERSGTPAAGLLETVSESEKSDRFEILKELQKGIQHKIYDGYIGRTVKALVEGKSVREKATDVFGHTTCNKVINFPGDIKKLAGMIVDIQVKSANPNSLYGELLK